MISIVTFRELADRDDLFVSHIWIWRAVSVVDQLRLLPDDIAAALPYTHHTILLPLKDQKTVNKFHRLLKEPDVAFGDLDKIEEIDAQQAKELAGIVTQMKEQGEAMEQRLLKRLAAVG